MLSSYTVWKPIHFNNPFYNFAEGLMSGSLIYKLQNLVFFHWKFALHLFLSSPMTLSPLSPSVPFLRGSSHWFRRFTPCSLQPSLEVHRSKGTWCSLSSHLSLTSVPLKLVCSPFSSLKIIVSDAEDRQNRNGVVLLSFCRLLSPSVSSRGPTPSCLFSCLLG